MTDTNQAADPFKSESPMNEVQNRLSLTPKGKKDSATSLPSSNIFKPTKTPPKTDGFPVLRVATEDFHHGFPVVVEMIPDVFRLGSIF